jgi:hypothetical protein
MLLGSSPEPLLFQPRSVAALPLSEPSLWLEASTVPKETKGKIFISSCYFAMSYSNNSPSGMAARVVKNAAIVTKGHGRAGKDDHSAVELVTMACQPRRR